MAKKKRKDMSELARSIVEKATGEKLTKTKKQNSPKDKRG